MFEIVRLTVVPVVIVAAVPVPVVAPAWVPVITGAPVVGREWRGLSPGDGSRAQPGKPPPDRYCHR